jgi:hypothetical protein
MASVVGKQTGMAPPLKASITSQIKILNFIPVELLLQRNAGTARHVGDFITFASHPGFSHVLPRQSRISSRLACSN